MTALTPTEAADLFRREPDRLIDVGAGTVAVRTVGTGPDVLFVHGWPVSGATFRTLLPHLTEHVTCHVIDLVGAGSSVYDDSTPVSIDGHIEAVRRVADELGLREFALVGHDSGGLIARHALAGDERVSTMIMIDTELPGAVGWRFKAFILGSTMPGFATMLGWIVGRRRLRRFPLVLGGAFVDDDLLDGEFEEFFLRPLNTDPVALRAAARIIDSFDHRYVDELTDVHRRIAVPVHLVWGREDRFFPAERARDAVGTFVDARLTVVDDAGLFSHEERPAEVAEAILQTVT